MNNIKFVKEFAVEIMCHENILESKKTYLDDCKNNFEMRILSEARRQGINVDILTRMDTSNFFRIAGHSAVFSDFHSRSVSSYTQRVFTFSLFSNKCGHRRN